MNEENQGISTNNFFWGSLFISWGIFWLLVTFGIVGVPHNTVTFLLKLSPIFWVILGIVLFVHSDSRIEEVRP